MIYLSGCLLCVPPVSHVCILLSISGPKDYCNMETFNATCRRDEIIIVNEAQYGRMNIGRCVKGNYGYLGCSSDVISFMDTKCSGRHECNFIVPDPDMYQQKTCPGDFTNYLRVSYSCVPGKYPILDITQIKD